MIDPVKRHSKLIRLLPRYMRDTPGARLCLDRFAAKIRREAMQECVDICEDFARRALDDQEGNPAQQSNVMLRTVALGPQDCALTIRARMEKP